MSAHWAAKLIGHPWTPETDCWWLFRRFCQMRHGIEMPSLAVGGDENLVPLFEAARNSGWSQVPAPVAEGDAVLMRNASSRRHIGIATVGNGRMGVLHNDGTMTPAGPVGCVVFSTFEELGRLGCDTFEFWRRARQAG